MEEGPVVPSPAAHGGVGALGPGRKVALERHPGRTCTPDTASTPSQDSWGWTPPWPAPSKLPGSSGVGRFTP